MKKYQSSLWSLSNSNLNAAPNNGIKSDGKKPPRLMPGVMKNEYIIYYISKIHRDYFYFLRIYSWLSILGNCIFTLFCSASFKKGAI